MNRRYSLLALAGTLLASSGVARANSGVVSFSWENIHREFARRHLSITLIGHNRGTWAELSEFFTDEARLALATRTEHHLAPTSAIDELLLYDARVSHCERLGISLTASWDVITNTQLTGLSTREGEMDGYFLLALLFSEQTSFWTERADQLFPLPTIEYVPLRPQDDTI